MPRDRKLSENSEVEEELRFEPIVYLPEVEVPTHEENEEVLLKMRAKLYRFDTTYEEAPEWKVFCPQSPFKPLSYIIDLF